MSLAGVNWTVASDCSLHNYNVRRDLQFPKRLDQNNCFCLICARGMDTQTTMLKGIKESDPSLGHLFRYNDISPAGAM